MTTSTSTPLRAGRQFLTQTIWIWCTFYKLTRQFHAHLSSSVLEFSGLPRWYSSKKSTYQCRRHAFNPWVGKIPWRRAWQPTPVFSPGEFHGWRSLANYHLWGHKGSDTTEQLITALFSSINIIQLWPRRDPARWLYTSGFSFPLGLQESDSLGSCYMKIDVRWHHRWAIGHTVSHMWVGPGCCDVPGESGPLCTLYGWQFGGDSVAKETWSHFHVWTDEINDWKWKSLSPVWLFETPWTIQFMEFSRQEYWNG